MPKGYIDFETFKSQHPHKPRIPLCPRCKKPMVNVTKNIFGKVMCADCLYAEETRKMASRIKKEEAEKRELAQLTEDDYIEE